MRILLFGHSYVNHLRQLGHWNTEVTLNNNNRVALEFLFRSYPGKDYQYFLEHDETFDVFRAGHFDAVVIVLGGNAITTRHSDPEIRSMAEEFFTKLNTYLRPGCVRFVAQVETRFCEPGNRFGTPEHAEFERRRTLLNNCYTVKLRRKGLIDRVILLGSKNYLNNRDNFADDGVHLKPEGLELYKRAVVSSVHYHLNKQLEEDEQ